MNASKNKLSRFQERTLNEIRLSKEVQEWTYKELGDYIIQHLWSKEDFDSVNAVVLTRTINILFKIQESKDKKKS